MSKGTKWWQAQRERLKEKNSSEGEECSNDTLGKFLNFSLSQISLEAGWLERESEKTFMVVSVSSLPTSEVIYHHDQSLEQEPKVASKIGKIEAIGWATQPRGTHAWMVAVLAFFVVRQDTVEARQVVRLVVRGEASSHGHLGWVSRKQSRATARPCNRETTRHVVSGRQLVRATQW